MKDSRKHRKLTESHRLIVTPGPALVAAALMAGALGIASPVSAQPYDVLFIRGAERSGGFLEASNDAQRTEQLADITNGSTSNGNHGWKTLATTLGNNGFNVSQVKEPLRPGDPASGQTEGGPLNFTDASGDNYVNLEAYDVVVFGSNNAAYGTAAVDAVEAYIRGGGGAIFISDANFGDDWADASDSDDPFLSRFRLTVNQDRGTYSLRRDKGEFLAPDHPILDGVDRFDGEGVTPITVGENLPAGVNVDILANAKGQVRRNDGNPGSSSSATAQDAALLAATIDQGRLIGHFDRNTFFNNNGAGTDITRFDNEQLAINMFTYAAVPEPASLALLGLGGAMILSRRRKR